MKNVHPLIAQALAPLAPPAPDMHALDEQLRIAQAVFRLRHAGECDDDPRDPADDYPTGRKCDDAARVWLGDRLGGPRE